MPLCLTRSLVCFSVLAITVSASGYDDARGKDSSAAGKTLTAPASAALNERGEMDASGSLARGDFSLRRRSTMELWRNRDRYRDAVLHAVRSEDPETAERARWVLARWQRGILADTPADLIGRLETMPPVKAIELLLESQRFAAATIAMREAAGSLDLDTITARIALTLDQRFPVYAQAAVMTGQTHQLSEFLEVACSTKELAVCHHDWIKLFPAAASEWEPRLGGQTECLLHLLDGDSEEAMKAAGRADRLRQESEVERQNTGAAEAEPDAEFIARDPQSLVRIVRMIGSQWTDMAAAAAASARSYETAAERLESLPADHGKNPSSDTSSSIVHYREEAVRYWSDCLIAADRSANVPLRRESIEGLLRNPEKVSLSAEVSSLIWRTLLIHGEIDAGLDTIPATEAESAALVALEASRGREALQRLGFPAQEIDTQLETWIDTAVAAQHALYQRAKSTDPQELAEAARQSETGVAPEVTRLLTLIRVLDSLSHDQAAWRIAERLSAADMKVKRAGGSQEFLVRDYVMSSLLWTSHSDWMIRLGMRPWESEPSQVTFSLITQMTVTDDRSLLPILMRYLKQQEPGIPVREAFRIACEVARGDDQDQRNHAALLPGLATSLQNDSLHGQDDNGTFFESLLDSQLAGWSELFLAHGRADLAEPFLRDQAASGDLNARFRLANEFRLSRALRRQVDVYQSIWDAVASARLTRANASFHDDVMIGVKAVAEQYKMARDSQDTRSADVLLNQLRAMACTPSPDMRGQIAEVLAECGQWEAADALYQSVLKMTAITADETMSLIDIARDYRAFAWRASASKIGQTKSAMGTGAIERLPPGEIELRRRANRWLDLAFAETLPSVDFRPPIYLRYPRQTARDQLGLLIMEMEVPPGDASTQTALTLLDRLHRLDRLDITSAEKLFPKLKKVGLSEPVDAALDKMLRTAEEHLKSFPADAVTANNVAWGAAMNEVELGTALQLSRHAVRFEPESAIYRDTLAEILARSGNPAEALTIEKGCLLDDPSQWHLHQQIERFQEILSKSR